jgi:hypothetical protein
MGSMSSKMLSSAPMTGNSKGGMEYSHGCSIITRTECGSGQQVLVRTKQSVLLYPALGFRYLDALKPEKRCHRYSYEVQVTPISSSAL